VFVRRGCLRLVALFHLCFHERFAEIQFSKLLLLRVISLIFLSLVATLRRSEGSNNLAATADPNASAITALQEETPCSG
jgi:hypothetical protein